ncbi:MAG: hypothetical protein QY328_00350 [Anaerolineales bacterium]|nr:hypothetical protein [Anaerolineales bacterium]WKZ40485.1 MAG: hypothetical protein QY328_00350 [Anaerolineales bacterium]
MSVFTILIAALGILFVVWALWFIVSMIRYIRSGRYEMDQRLREICK